MKAEFAEFVNRRNLKERTIRFFPQILYPNHLKIYFSELFYPADYHAISLMKRSLCGTLFAFLMLPAFAQRNPLQDKAIVLKRQIEKNHFNPKAVNDSFSSEMFSKILKELDPRQNLFTADDYAFLSGYRYKLDDELSGSPWKFLDAASNLYQQRLKRADTLVVSILQKPLDVNIDDKISFSREDGFHFAASPAELRLRWTKWFKFLLLDKIQDLYENDSTKTPVKTLLAKNESSIRERLKTKTQKTIKELSDPSFVNSYLQEIYFNALATTFDPHTEYFSPREKENFQSELSTENFSFGFEIEETKEGKVVVAQLIPGGPAWKSGELHVNDELLQVQWQGKPATDVSNMSYDEVDDLLNESNHGTISLKVKKANGVIYSVTLQKEKIETQDNVVKGYVLKGAKNIGYISLPDFYTSWGDENGSGCANDVAREIIRLKRENIDGLILDVRFNGGGSLGEALQMAGIFIDEGPLTATKDRTGKLVFLKDPNRGTVYDGPLVLMVNGQSASASEMLAAALQDYNRAIIVGSPTYGKATMQQIFPMDTMSRNSSAESPYGYVKITTGKLYRVSGQTAQLKGVIPDIKLPDAFEAVHFGEKFEPDVLPSDTARRNPYYKPLPLLPIEQLRSSSNERVNSNKNFQEIKEAIKTEAQINEATTRVVPLKLDLFEKWAIENNKRNILFDEEKEAAASKLFVAHNHKDDMVEFASDAYSKAINDVTLKNIQQDVYIEEAFQILLDFLKMQTKN